MKRIGTIVCALLILSIISLAALADSEAVGTVVNCNNWVSLRVEPDTSAERLAEVPLGATVTGCEIIPDTRFVRCCYEDTWGYILAEYLSGEFPVAEAEAATVQPEAEIEVEPEAPEEETVKTVVFEETVNGYTVSAWREMSDGMEVMHVTCVNPTLDVNWTANTTPMEVSQTNQTNAFIGGTAQAPQIMLYVSQRGLYALDPDSGEPKWILLNSKVNLGDCNCAAVTEDGTMYVGGYFGPHPVAIDVDGNVLWQSDVGRADVYWLYDIQLKEDGLYCRYEWCTEEGEGTVVYDYDGNLVSITVD